MKRTFALVLALASFATAQVTRQWTEDSTLSSQTSLSANVAPPQPFSGMRLAVAYSGAPATVSLAVKGCTNVRVPILGSGQQTPNTTSVCDTLLTDTRNTNHSVVVAGAYDFYTYTETFTGGTNPRADIHSMTSGFSPAQVTGAGVTDGSLPVGSPIAVGGLDGTGNCNGGGCIKTIGVVPNGSIATIVQTGLGDGLANSNYGLFGVDCNGCGIIAGVGPNYWNGATWDRGFYCPNTATFTAASTTTQIVALSGATKIRVCSFSINPSTATAGSTDLVYGTGANCGTGTTTLTGAYTLPASAVVSITPGIAPTGPLITPAAQALCIRTVTASASGFVTWAQY